MRSVLRRAIFSFFLSFVSFSFVVSPALAFDYTTNRPPSTAHQSPSTGKMMLMRPQMGSGEGAMRDMRKIRLDGIKLKYCDTVSKNIANRSNHINDLVTNMEKRLDSYAQGVENRYQSVLVPAGKTVSNYDALVTAIQTQKDQITPLLAKIQSDISSFSCSTDDPGGQVTQYRTDVMAVISGLETYKMAVRDLIVAVVKVQGTVVPTGVLNSITPEASQGAK